MELMLGTVQFGLAYGVAGADRPVEPREVRRILDCAAGAGVRLIDTAQAYGDIESRLRELLPAGTDWRITTKISAAPFHASENQAIAHVRERMALARQHGGEYLEAVLLHDGMALKTDIGSQTWSALSGECAIHGLRAGASLYSPAELDGLQVRCPGLAQVQLPANALDQRLSTSPRPQWPAVMHIRSAFLQGLLLLPPDEARRKVPAAAAALDRWHAWCAAQGQRPLEAAFSVLRGSVQAQACVIGVDSARQFEEILRAWEAARPCAAPELASEDPAVIDPRQWKVRS